jgi:PAP2 superfamily
VWLAWQWAVVLAAGLAAASFTVRWYGGRWSLAADFFTQASLIAALYSLWQLIASYAVGRATGAVQHGMWVWHLERDLYWPSEAWLQHLILHHRVLVEACNVFYAGVHVPALGVFLVWLFVRHRSRFAHYRDALAVLTLLCLLAYLVPVAPPRLLPKLGMVDTGLLYHQSVYGRPGTGIADQLSAMPSVHMAWSLFIAVTVIQVSRSRWRWFIVAHPILTMLVVVVTANHFWLDGVAAAGLLVVALSVVAAIERLRIRQVVRRLYRPAAPDVAVLTAEGDGLVEAAATRDGRA